MRSGTARLAGAALAGLFSIAAAGGSISLQLEDESLTAGRGIRQIARLPEGILPPGVPKQPEAPPLSESERRAIGQGLWREPLDNRLFNLFFADAVRRGQPGSETDAMANLLAQLGWRSTAAQQNLAMRALLDGRFDNVLDHVDSLLRRQRRLDLAYTILATMEALPQVHGVVLDKLLANPEWRSDYLSAINPQSAPELLKARVQTLDALLDTPAGLSRREIAPSLIALNAAGQGRAARALLLRQSGRAAGDNLIHDPDFEQLGALAGTPDLGIPFEWHLGQDLGYTAQNSAQGVTISWDRRGVPIFLAQTVPVQPGSSYTLTLQGKTDSGSLERLLSPVLLCATRTARFEPVAEARDGLARYRIGPLPDSCDMGALAISGAIDTGNGAVNIDLSRVVLQPLS